MIGAGFGWKYLTAIHESI